jgi:5-dehydro-2-deoxygluconokinase
VEADVGMLADQRFGQDALNAATGRDWWMARPVEVQGSRPLAFEHGRSVGSNLIAWPQEQIIKCLVQFHPDDEPLLRLEQEAQLKALYQAALASGHELLLEIMPPKDHPSTYPDVLYRSHQAPVQPGHLPGVVEDRGADRAEVSGGSWMSLIEERDPYCRGVVLLGLNASAQCAGRGIPAGGSAAAGRAAGLPWAARFSRNRAGAWLAGEIDDETLIERVQANLRATDPGLAHAQNLNTLKGGSWQAAPQKQISAALRFKTIIGAAMPAIRIGINPISWSNDDLPAAGRRDALEHRAE